MAKYRVRNAILCRSAQRPYAVGNSRNEGVYISTLWISFRPNGRSSRWRVVGVVLRPSYFASLLERSDSDSTALLLRRPRPLYIAITPSLNVPQEVALRNLQKTTPSWRIPDRCRLSQSIRGVAVGDHKTYAPSRFVIEQQYTTHLLDHLISASKKLF